MANFNILSLCTGIGGLDTGVELAVPSARVVCMVEGEAFCVECMASACEAMGMAAPPCWSDVKTFDGKPWRGVVDCLTAGYPCQPFSVAGKRLGADDPRHLWPHVARIIGEVEPPWVFLENVAGHLRLGFKQVRDDLRGMGYAAHVGVFTPTEAGVPHRNRARLFALAYAAGCNGSARDSVASSGDGGASPQPGGLDGVEVVESWEPSHSWWACEPGDDLVVDGATGYVDRLRALGNGVVPLQAAYAFTTLLALHCDD